MSVLPKYIGFIILVILCSCNNNRDKNNIKGLWKQLVNSETAEGEINIIKQIREANKQRNTSFTLFAEDELGNKTSYNNIDS